MRRFLNMPPQIIRLVLLTIAIICIYFCARYLLTPQSFGQYGHYRGNALQEIAAREPFWAGRKTCDACHGEIVQKLAKAEHKGLSCETCHGPSKAHVENPEVKLPKLSYSQCVRCHEASPSRPAWLHQMTPAKHYTGQVCTECHVPHQPNEVPP
jgi:hypothetical protein